MMKRFRSGVPNGLLWFEQLVRFYVEWVLMFSADCCKFLQVRILFCFLVVLMDTLCMIFIILDVVLDFGLVRVLCLDFLLICWLPQNWYLFHSVFHLFQNFLDSRFWNIPKYSGMMKCKFSRHFSQHCCKQIISSFIV